MDIAIRYLGYLVVLVVLAIPLGKYISKVMAGEKVFLSKILVPCEKFIYKILRIKDKDEMDWKKYAISAVIFSAIGFMILFVLQMIQGFLPGNPESIPGMSWDLSFNTAVSFITNTNWQAYSGEAALSYVSQAFGLTVQNFLSAATGIAVLFALIRGFTKVQSKGLGNFWVDVTRSVLYILLPLSIVVSIALVSQGVTQSVNSYQTVELSEPIVLEDGTTVTTQMIPTGPSASQIAIKQLGTNGGGFYGVNSAHPLENPTAISNLIEVISLLLIPAALCFSFGRSIKDRKQGIAIFSAMFIMLVIALSTIAVNEQMATPQLAQNETVDISAVDQAGGNMEGKEARFGIVGSSTWAAYTTAASNGSVNSMHDSYTPLGGMVTMVQMQLGEVIFGGVGCGLYGMLAFAILTVFIAGLMVGRTPEYLGKKIEPYEMKMAVIACLATPVAILVGSGIAALVPGVIDSVSNGGAHGFSELLYTYTSTGGNNGSAFAGFAANTPFINVSTGFVMLFARFVPIVAILAIAGRMVTKKKIATTAGTLSTCNGMFVFLLIFVVLLVGALSFFPALALGPIAEFFGMF